MTGFVSSVRHIIDTTASVSEAQGVLRGLGLNVDVAGLLEADKGVKLALKKSSFTTKSFNDGDSIWEKGFYVIKNEKGEVAGFETWHTRETGSKFYGTGTEEAKEFEEVVINNINSAIDNLSKWVEDNKPK